MKRFDAFCEGALALRMNVEIVNQVQIKTPKERTDCSWSAIENSFQKTGQNIRDAIRIFDESK